jgi:hypothetical protein
MQIGQSPENGRIAFPTVGNSYQQSAELTIGFCDLRLYYRFYVVAAI